MSGELDPLPPPTYEQLEQSNAWLIEKVEIQNKKINELETILFKPTRIEKHEGAIGFALTVQCKNCQQAEYYQPAHITLKASQDNSALQNFLLQVFRTIENKFYNCPECQKRRT